MTVCLKAALLALTGALSIPTAALLFPDCPSTPRDRALGSRCPGSTQYPAGKWAQSHSLQRGHLVLFMILKHVAGGSDTLRPPGTAAEQIIAWNLFWVRYFLSVVKGLN